MSPAEHRQLIRESRPRPGDPQSDTLTRALKTFIENNPADKVNAALPRIIKAIRRQTSVQDAFNLLQRLEVACGWRRPTLAIYDHTLHLIGGAQKYGCTMANALQDVFDVTLITNQPVSQSQLRDWYRLDLSGCRITTIPIPFYEKKNKEHLDPAQVTSRRMENPFHLISRESGLYDFFVNNSMVEMVLPLANVASFVCHFPERRPSSYFYVDRYPHLIFNSRYTAAWIEKKWQLQPGIHIYPPVDMDGGLRPSAKKNLILSAARFDPGGNKQQLRMVQFFLELRQRWPRQLAGWKLVLAGGSPRENEYLQEIRRLVSENRLKNIELKVNLPAADLQRLYRQAKIFWHLCGLNQVQPELVEHFGMTTVEAMQNGCVPITFAGGGQTEIITHDVSGLLFESKSQLLEQTLKLIAAPRRLQALAARAYRRGREFGRPVFTARVRQVFSGLLDDYRLVS